MKLSAIFFTFCILFVNKNIKNYKLFTKLNYIKIIRNISQLEEIIIDYKYKLNMYNLSKNKYFDIIKQELNNIN